MEINKSLLQEKPSFYLHILLLGFLVLALMLRQTHLASILLKIIILVSVLLIGQQFKQKNNEFIKPAFLVAILPTLMVILSYLAKGYVDYKDDAKNYVQAYCIVINLIFLAKYNTKNLIAFSSIVIQSIIILYTAIQTVALTIFLHENGSTSNPHYLALFSAVAFCISVFYFLKTTSWYRLIYLILACILLAIILYTSSRPVWLGMIFSLIFFLPHLNKNNLIKFLAIFISIQAALIFCNLFNYKNRIYDLILNISTEERVSIWNDAWVMQKTSDRLSWLYGHGLNSFYEAFKAYSRHHPSHDFRSPHNIFLELLYTSGILGVVVVLTLYYCLYSKNLKLSLLSYKYSDFATLILILTTISLILNGLNWTFHSSSSLYPIAFYSGLSLLTYKLYQQESQLGK